jgi:hypothetical protein
MARLMKIEPHLTVKEVVSGQGSPHMVGQDLLHTALSGLQTRYSDLAYLPTSYVL